MSRKVAGLIIMIVGGGILVFALWLASKGLQIAWLVSLCGIVPFLFGGYIVVEGAIHDEAAGGKG